MKSLPRLFAFVLFLSFCPQTQAPTSQNVRVTLNHLSATTCRVRTSDEYQAGERTVKEPTLNNFTVLKAGEARATKFTPLIFSATTNPKVADGQTLQMGRSWVVLDFSLLPEYFTLNRPSIERFRQKWSTIGQLDDRNFSTEPFPIDIAIKPNSPKCETH